MDALTLMTPPTEAEVAGLIAVTSAFAEGDTARRLAFERDRLRSELEAARRALFDEQNADVKGEGQARRLRAAVKHVDAIKFIPLVNADMRASLDWLLAQAREADQLTRRRCADCKYICREIPPDDRGWLICDSLHAQGHPVDPGFYCQHWTPMPGAES